MQAAVAAAASFANIVRCVHSLTHSFPSVHLRAPSLLRLVLLLLHCSLQGGALPVSLSLETVESRRRPSQNLAAALDERRKGRRRRVSSSPLSPYSACALRRALPPLLPSLIPMSFLVGGEEAGGRAGVSGFSSSCFLSSQRRPWPSTINSRPQHRRRAVRGSKSPSPTSNSTRNAQCCVSVCI